MYLTPDVVFDGMSRLKDRIYEYTLLETPDIRKIQSLNEPFYWTVMSPSQFCMPPVVSASGTASGLVYNTGGIWSHWVNVMILCYLLWGFFFLKHTECGCSPSLRWADVNRSQVLEYKAYSAPEGQWKWDPKVPQFHMLIFNSCCPQKLFFFHSVNAEACFCPMSGGLQKRHMLCLEFRISLVFVL